MGRINQGLQLLGVTIATGHGEEAADVVAEAAVVGVLLHGHQLHTVVALGLDAGEDVGSEVRVASHFWLFAGDAHVGLVYA